MERAEELLRKGRYSQEQLATALMDAHFATIHHIAYSILRSIEEADDVAQETFIVALRSIGRYRPGTSLRAWLSSIAVNQCRDRLRRRQARQRWHQAWHRLHLGQPPEPSPEVHAVRGEANAELWHAVEQLGEKHSVPIVLRYVHDMKAAEIAEILGVSEGTVYSRLHYACRKLERRLSAGTLETGLSGVEP
ncbi:MAG: RNA polymerase sigma factor [Caldilineales bacterium]